MPQGFTHNRVGELEYLTVPQLTQSGFIHAFSTRKGGVSQGALGSLNLGFSRGDARENVLENYRILTEAIGVSVESLVLTAQTHTDHIRKVGRADRGEGITKKTFADVDAIMTNEPGVTLVTFHADCTPVFLADPKRRAVCLIHSGWRGTVQKIAAKAVDAMAQAYGSRPADLLAAIGPSAGPCCYEVSAEVGQAIDEAGGGGCLQYKEGNEKPFADLWTANRNILMAAGVPAAQITVAGECTCHEQLYYSHRRQGAERGSLAAFLSIGEE
jgi:YfiH family protein